MTTVVRADSPEALAAVRRIAEACRQADGVATLNEQALLQLRRRGVEGVRLWVAGDGAAGFALLRGTELDLAVHPDHRGAGFGGSLAEAALSGLDRVEAWSHADHPAAARLAERYGVPRARELVIMSRPTSVALGEVAAPEGIVVRTFRPDDADAVVRVNATSFAHHPEQGRMSLADFRERTEEPWFDPEGLFLAFDAADPDHLLGFHWTKLHPDTEPLVGEVYVVGVLPEAAGRGLGTALTRLGLAHLAEAGASEVILYVEGDNAPALAVYNGQGFSRVRTEVQYRGPLG